MDKMNIFCQEKSTYRIRNWTIQPRSDQPHNGSSANNMTTVLFVHGIPEQINEGYLLYLFSFEGCLPISRIKKIKDYAFIHYFTRWDAETAMNKLNGYNIGSSSIVITWAKRNTRSFFESHIFNRTTNPNIVETSQNGQYDRNAFQNNPMKILAEVCKTNGWGEPVYHVVHTSSSVDEIETTFSAKVYIPYSPLPLQYFSVSEVFVSPKEAKNSVAEYALKSIVFNHDRNASAVRYLPYTHKAEKFKENWSSCATIWNSETQSSVDDSEFLDQDSFHNLLSSAASLASVQLQTNSYPQ